MRAFSIIILATVAMALAACTSELPLEDRPCPCADGWKCCAYQNVCVPEGESCPGEETDSTVADGYGKACTTFGKDDWACKGQKADFCIIDGPSSTGTGICTYSDCETRVDACPQGTTCCSWGSESACFPDGHYGLQLCSDIDTNVDTDTYPDTDTDGPNPEGFGDPCDYFGTGQGGCAGKEANTCLYMVPLQEGQCTVLCTDTASHSDCPPDWYCCNFTPIADYKLCMPQEWWEMVSEATCSNKPNETGLPHGSQCSQLFGPLGEITGVCQKPNEACAGGFAGSEYIPPLYPGKDPGFDCQQGLLCCIDTDQCAKIDAGLQALVPSGLLQEGSGASCQPNGGCVEPAYEISNNFACPDGQTCCFTTLQ